MGSAGSDGGGAGSDERAGSAERARALALLEATHSFPCVYEITVIAHSGDAVAEAIRLAAALPPDGEAAGGDDAPREITLQARPSSGGRYTSYRVSVWARDGAEVLQIYARMRAVAGVVTML